MEDTISRKKAIDSICRTVCDNPEICQSPCDEIKVLEIMPSAQPERLTDDDFETIRIHLNAYKEKLCNQQRWEEADEYQRIIDRFMAFASAHPEIVRCKDCEYFRKDHGWNCIEYTVCAISPIHKVIRKPDDYCSRAERRTDERSD